MHFLNVFSFTMFYAYRFNLTCLPEEVLKGIQEQMNVMVKEEIHSLIMYQRIAMDLAAGPLNAGRVLAIQLFFGESERSLSEETLRNKPNGVSKSELAQLVNYSILKTNSDVQEINPRDRAHRGPVSDFCPSPVAVRINGERKERKTVTFNPDIIVHLVPYEDRTSEWLQCAINRAHFQRRIQLFEELFTAL